MNDRIKSWMKGELDIEWSSATYRSMSSALNTDLPTITKRIVVKDKMTNIDLTQKNSQLAQRVQQKRKDIQRKKSSAQEMENWGPWNVCNHLLDTYNEANINSKVFHLKLDDLNTDNTLTDLQSGVQAWQTFHNNPRSSNDNFFKTPQITAPSSISAPSESSHEKIKNSVNQEMQEIASLVHFLKNHLQAYPRQEPCFEDDSSNVTSGDSLESFKTFQSHCVNWPKIFQ